MTASVKSRKRSFDVKPINARISNPQNFLLIFYDFQNLNYSRNQIPHIVQPNLHKVPIHKTSELQ